MNRIRRTSLATIFLLCAATFAQAPATSHVQPAKGGYYTADLPLDLSLVVPPPPAPNSETSNADLATLHQIQQSRTPAQVAAAQTDEKQENMFYLHTVLGDKFNAQNLPLTAALSQHLKNEEATNVLALKAYFHRPRPYQFDSTLHPVCGTTTQPNSYPSGHTATGYLMAFTLIEMVPEKSHQILERADDFAHNRMVCGVHYPSDLVAGREVAYAIFGRLMASPVYRSELAAARAEMRKRLGLN